MGTIKPQIGNFKTYFILIRQHSSAAVKFKNPEEKTDRNGYCGFGPNGTSASAVAAKAKDSESEEIKISVALIILLVVVLFFLISINIYVHIISFICDLLF